MQPIGVKRVPEEAAGSRGRDTPSVEAPVSSERILLAVE